MSRNLLGTKSAAAVVVASMIGAGIFTTTGFLAADLGHRGAIMLVWVLGGVYATLGALCYGRLARAMPESGGEYLFLSRTIHPDAGWLAGWVSLVVGFSAPAALAASAFGHYLSPSFFNTDAQIIATLLLVIAALFHTLTTRLGNRVQVAMVMVKLLLIVGFIVIAFVAAAGSGGTPPPGPPPAPESWPSLGALAVALLWVSFSYSGWNAAVYIAGEVENAEHQLPRALLLATGIVTVLYFFLNLAFLKLAPLSAIAGHQDVALRVAAQSDWPWFEHTTAILVALALATSVFAMTQLGPRVYARMADDGCAPAFLRTPPDSSATPPRAAILLQTALALTLLWTASFDAVLTWTGITLACSTTLTVYGLIRSRGASPAAVGFVVLSLLMLILSIRHRPTEAAWGLTTLAVGWLLRRSLQTRLK